MTPEMVATKDYMDGMGAGDNPYPAGTEEYARWQEIANELWADELTRELQQ